MYANLRREDYVKLAYVPIFMIPPIVGAGLYFLPVEPVVKAAVGVITLSPYALFVPAVTWAFSREEKKRKDEDNRLYTERLMASRKATKLAEQKRMTKKLEDIIDKNPVRYNIG